MYQSYFGLNYAPFSIVPDHRVVYMSESHRDAVAHLLYSLKQSGGFVQLTGEVGTGKTTVSRYLLQHLPENVDVALLLNPRINEKEMIETICDELEIPYPPAATLRQLLSALNEYLLASHASGRHTVLIIDEAQNLSREVLEQVRLLTNLETSTDKLLQIILIGQPELVKVLGRHDLRQLSQRIVGRIKLEPLNLNETREYISYRLQQAGCERSLFSPQATRLVHKLSGGVPRVINILCDTALMGAYSGNKDKVSKKAVMIAAKEILPDLEKASFWSWKWLPYAAIASVVVAFLFGLQSTNALSGAVTAMKTRVMDAWQQEPEQGPIDERVDLTLAAVREKEPNKTVNNSEVADKTSETAEVQTIKQPEKTVLFKNPEMAKNEPSASSLPDQENPENNAGNSKENSSRFDLIYRLGVPFRSN